MSPIYSLAIDVAVLVMLLLAWPTRSEWRRIVVVTGGAGVAAGAIWLGLVALGQSPDQLLAEWRGETVKVHPVQTDVGEGPAGPAQPFVITVRNHGPQSVRLVGGTTDCACLATSDLPVTIPPGGSVAIRVQFKRAGRRASSGVASGSTPTRRTNPSRQPGSPVGFVALDSSQTEVDDVEAD